MCTVPYAAVMSALAWRTAQRFFSLLLATIVLSHWETRNLIFLNRYVIMRASGGPLGLNIQNLEPVLSYFLSQAGIKKKKRFCLLI